MPVFGGSLSRNATRSRSKSRSKDGSTQPGTHDASLTSAALANSDSVATEPESTDQSSSISKGKAEALLPSAKIHPTSKPNSSLSSSPSANSSSTASLESSSLSSPFNINPSHNLKRSPSLSRLSFKRKNNNPTSTSSTPPVPALPGSHSPSAEPGPTTPTAATVSTFDSTFTAPASYPSALSSPSSDKQQLQQQSQVTQSPESYPQEIETSSNMLLPPQPAFLGRRSSSMSGHGGDSGLSSGYNSRNASTTSFTSSVGAGGSYVQNQSEESFGERSNRGRLEKGGRAYGNGSDGNGKTKPKERSNSHGAAAATGIKGFGRRLFNRSTPQPLASRSHSTSSSATSQSSPPLTPTTPPLPNDALNKRAAASAMMSPLTLNLSLSSQGGLPQLPPLNMKFSSSSFSPREQERLGSNDQSVSSLSLNSGQNGSNLPSQSPTSNIGLAYASQTTNSFSSKEGGNPSSSMPTKPPTSASPPRRNGSLPFVTDRVENRGIPSPDSTPMRRNLGRTSEADDSDFLRAVLNFGDTDSEVATSADTSHSFASTDGGFSSFATSNTSTSESFKSPFGARWNSPGIPKTMRESEARDWERRERENAVKRNIPKHRRGLFSQRDEDEDSEDDYGEEDDQDNVEHIKPRSEGRPQRNLSPTDALPRRGSSPSQWPTSKAVSLSRSPSQSTADSFHSLNDDSRDSQVSQPLPQRRVQPQPQVGLETPGKRSLYTATLLKVHPHLSSCLRVSSAGQEVSNLKLNDVEIRFPRSINQTKTLQSHSSNFSFTRSLSVAVARTSVMKRLKRERLSLSQEIEISWFQTKYGSELISPEDIAAGIASRPLVSPEALAVSPVLVSNASASASLLSRSSSADTLSLATDSESLKRDHNGLTLWTQRRSFLDRCSEFRPADEFNPDDLVISQLSSNFSKRLSQQAQGRARRVKPAPLSYSARICALAEIAPPAKLGADAPPPTKFRKRDAERPSREDGRSPKTIKAPPPWIASRTGPSPAVKQAMDRSASLATLMGNQQSSQVPSSLSFQPQNSSNVLSGSTSTTSTVSPLPSLQGSSSSMPKRASTRSAHPPPNRRVASGRAHATVREEDEDNASAIMARDNSEGESSEEEEEVPLALLHAHRKEKERIAVLEAEVQALRAAQQHSQLEQERYELAERRRKEEEKMAEYNRKILAEARARRGKTEHSAVLNSNNYGAGNATALSPSTSRTDLRRSSSNLKSKVPQSSSLADFQSNSNVGLNPSTSIYSNRAAVSKGSSSNLPSPNAGIPASPSRSLSKSGRGLVQPCNNQTLSPPTNTLSPPSLAPTAVRRRSSFNGSSDGSSPLHNGTSSPLVGSPPAPTPHRSSTLPNSISVQQNLVVNGYSNSLGYGAPHSPGSPSSPLSPAPPSPNQYTGLPSSGSMRVSSRQPHRSNQPSKPFLNPSQSSQFGGLLGQQQAQQQAMLDRENSMRHAQMMAHQAQQMHHQAVRQQHHQSQMTNSMSMGQHVPYFGSPQPLVNLDPKAIPSSATQRFSAWQ